MKFSKALGLALILAIQGCSSVALKPSRSVAQSGQSYFVDHEKGDDNCDGKSPESAWQTFINIKNKKFEPGDQVSLKRNQIWRETLYLKSSGTRDQMISIGSYGYGNFPRIDGSVEVQKRE